MATSKLVLRIRVRKWAVPVIFLSAIFGFKVPKWCFKFTVGVGQ